MTQVECLHQIVKPFLLPRTNRPMDLAMEDMEIHCSTVLVPGSLCMFCNRRNSFMCSIVSSNDSYVWNTSTSFKVLGGPICTWSGDKTGIEPQYALPKALLNQTSCNSSSKGLVASGRYHKHRVESTTHVQISTTSSSIVLHSHRCVNVHTCTQTLNASLSTLSCIVLHYSCLKLTAQSDRPFGINRAHIGMKAY